MGFFLLVIAAINFYFVLDLGLNPDTFINLLGGGVCLVTGIILMAKD